MGAPGVMKRRSYNPEPQHCAEACAMWERPWPRMPLLCLLCMWERPWPRLLLCAMWERPWPRSLLQERLPGATAATGHSRSEPHANVPNTPAEGPGTPAETLSIPAEALSTPAHVPNAPAGVPNSPAGTLSTPAEALSTPAGVPNTPAGTPSTAAGTLSTPAEALSTSAEVPNVPADVPDIRADLWNLLRDVSTPGFDMFRSQLATSHPETPCRSTSQARLINRVSIGERNQRSRRSCAPCKRPPAPHAKVGT